MWSFLMLLLVDHLYLYVNGKVHFVENVPLLKYILRQNTPAANTNTAINQRHS